MKTPLAIAISTALLSSAALAATPVIKGHTPELTSVKTYNNSKIKTVSQQRVIVELEADSIAKAFGNVSELPGNQLQQMRNAPSFESHLKQINAEQNAFVSQLSQKLPGAKVEKRFDTIFNGMTISAAQINLDVLKSIPGVKAIYPEEMYYAQMDASLAVINTDAMWQAVSGMENAGKGVRVAIIDGGIRPENPMFSGEGFEAPADLPTNDYCSTVDSSFCNNKLIVARWSAPTFAVCEDEYLSPLGYGGHGTHVAGSAVGNRVTTEQDGIEVELSGVAPGAYLMSYKALYNGPDCDRGSGSNAMLMEALEYAIEDGADVINNSWGGGAGANPAGSVYKPIFEAAEAAGVVVVSAAGNDGNGAKTIGCPACIESGIAVANSTAGRFFANNFTFSGEDLLAINSNSPVALDEDITAEIRAAAVIDAENFEGCDAFEADSFKDSIALISRGACTFTQKAQNAADAGAVAMVVYNSNDGAPISMFMPEAPLAGVMISKADGASVLESWSEGDEGTIGSEVSRIVDKNFADMINSSSSRGPNGDENVLKPDIAAPGTSILSAASPDADGGDFGFKTGTSMASPHVAGAAAIMKQLKPDWSAVDIKTALMSTAQTDGIKDDDNMSAATPFAMGAGRMDLAAAANAVLTFDKGSIAIDSCVTECTFTRTVHNKSDEATTWTLSAMADGAAVTVMPSTLELEAGASAEFTVKVDTSLSASGDWVFGEVMFTGAAQDAHLPIAVLAKDSSDSNLISTVEVGTELNAAEPFEVKAMVNNSVFEDTVTMQAYVPEGTKLTSADDVDLVTTGASTYGTEVNTELGRIAWTGKLDLPEMTAELASGTSLGGVSIVDLGVTPQTCAGGCDETAFTFTVPSFVYNGSSYDRITISDNGIIVVGGGETGGTWNNRELPNSIAPNNILAPFWADYDLDGADEGDSGGGSIAIASFTLGGEPYLAVEWNKVQLWDDDSGNTHTFLTWIKLGTEEDIFFTYPELQSIPSNVSIGAENIAGSVGVTYHYNGEGGAVANGDLVQLGSQVGGTVEVTYKVQATENTPTSADSVTLDEDDKAEFNVLDNDTADYKLARTSITDGATTAKAQRLVPVGPAGKLENVALVDEPNNGTLELGTDGATVYTPNKDFFGTDSFTYSVEDGSDLPSDKTMVTLTVKNINDAPVLTGNSFNVIEGNSVSVNVASVDADADALEFTWTQTSGSDVTFTQDGSTISFNAPAPGQLTFEVTASDGTVDSEAVSVEVNVSAKPVVNVDDDNGGSMGWLTILLLPLAMLRRKFK